MEIEVNTCFDLFMEQFPTLSPEAKKFTRSFLTIQSYKKKEFLYLNGEVQEEIAYICQGLLRKFYVNEKGNEIITGFSREKEYATDYPSFLRQKPSKYSLQFLEPSVVVKMPYKKLQEAYNKHKANEMYGRLAAERVLTRETDRVESLLFASAEERYLNFLDKNEDIINRISLSHLASYLGIERQSLSRIRSKLAKRK
ncbi:Crp/Fnr family transcriptional regulator [Antarcticibacterium flavum]|uniref:Crp/Fnr family transcriptional regulator n=1 Tax=Antarcticibacterium flavum TaxID=2058175 RepID=A0A5B7X6N3_9FLAO|nr:MULTISPECIES: Crp/Fnr family transcriptional regulator [Antarcticibacterium]MCM4161777.1 Crp/Fnr family transcriptional regulator [Antarcticibacterium sp. W02-3]QCY71144.1 Crp/Fnr family transcriptional regulator [Antarcticibacterium flavum]